MEKILVVDDEVGILQLCKRVLETGDLLVHTASDGESALKLIAGEKYDLVLTDLKMPGIGGLELLKRVKELNPQTAVIMITGQATIESAIEALKSGAYDYVLKPFDLNELTAAVHKCLEHNRLRRQGAILNEALYLYQFAQELNKEHSEKEMLGFILQRAAKTLGGDAGSLFLLIPKDGVLRAVASYGMNELKCELQLGQGVVGWVAQNHQPLLIQEEVNKLPQFKDLTPRADIASSMVVPVMSQQTLLGIICISRFVHKSNFQFTPHDLESLQIFALHSGLILASLRHQLAQKELDELKSEFVSNVSHEVRTPLMAISGAVELLMAGTNPCVQDVKTKMFLDLIARNTQRMHFLVNDLLDFSRLETGILKLYFTGVNLRMVIEEVLQDLQFKAKEKDITFQKEFPQQDSEIVADREKFKQVVTNLVGNAVKFTCPGGVIKIAYSVDASGQVLFSVADTGIGIPKDKQEKIFEKFYQVDGSPSREKSGFGLGLAIVKSIVEHHEGRIWVESEEGKGATFYISIPGTNSADCNIKA
jgi:signal transduction histidine kinase